MAGFFRGFGYQPEEPRSEHGCSDCLIDPPRNFMSLRTSHSSAPPCPPRPPMPPREPIPPRQAGAAQALLEMMGGEVQVSEAVFENGLPVKLVLVVAQKGN